jgi:hypothetical protein
MVTFVNGSFVWADPDAPAPPLSTFWRERPRVVADTPRWPAFWGLSRM